MYWGCIQYNADVVTLKSDCCFYDKTNTQCSLNELPQKSSWHHQSQSNQLNFIAFMGKVFFKDIIYRKYEFINQFIIINFI